MNAEEQEGYAPLAPEFVIELTSPSDYLDDVRRKVVGEWIPNGVQLAWVIDADHRSVTVFHGNGDVEELVNPSSILGHGPICGFELVLSRVWVG